jgi:hypothetical protein
MKLSLDIDNEPQAGTEKYGKCCEVIGYVEINFLNLIRSCAIAAPRSTTNAPTGSFQVSFSPKNMMPAITATTGVT